MFHFLFMSLTISSLYAQSPLLTDDLKVEGVVVKAIPNKPEGADSCPCAKAHVQKALAGDLSSMFSLANCYRMEGQPLPGVDKNTKNYCSIKPEVYADWMGAAATRGFAPAQYAYGTAWFFGSGVREENRENGINWWAQAASQGFGPAYYSLADIYETGFGKEKNKLKALELFKEAKKNGDERAQERISKLEADASHPSPGPK